MKNKTCCFTGYRELSFWDSLILSCKLKKEIKKLVGLGVIYFGNGGARDFDTIAAKAVLKMKKHYPDIHLILVLPCAEHTSNWNSYDKEEFEYVKLHADKVKVLSNHYYSGCMHTRNRHLVDNSSYCICYKRKDFGDTAYTVNYAIKRILRIIEL
ncbi:MAG: DUF1273 family protein [Oscillospiraceae bacterium]|nr:DUF1273 family protein [Oscillospiraceae bacterium]